MSEQLTPSNGRDWRKLRETTTTITLPYSGQVVEMGHAQLDQLLLAGKIPDTLTPLVADVLWSPIEQRDADARNRGDKAFFELINAVVAAVLVNPHIVSKPAQDDEIAISDLDFADKLMIYKIATQPLAVLHRFRQEQAPTVEPVHEGDDLQPATE